MKKVILFALILVSCTFPSDSETPEETLPEYTAADSLEATTVALWFAGQLTAPDSVVSRVLADLHVIRTSVPDSLHAIVSTRFRPPWRLGALNIGFDDSTANAVRDSTYNGWSMLADSLQPLAIVDPPDRLDIASLAVDSSYNPWVLSRMYATLPGVRFAEPNLVVHIAGGTFPLFARPVLPVREYIFVADYEGTMSQQHWYYQIGPQDSVHSDYWEEFTETEPPWTAAMDSVLRHFGGWGRQ
mgnify:CR=1 FL=1